MKKIIAKKAFAGSLMSLYALGLLGCKFKPATNIPKSIDPVTVTEIDNEEVVIAQTNLRILLKNKDRKIREEVYNKFYNEINKYSGTLASLLSSYCTLNDEFKLTYNNNIIETNSPGIIKLTFNSNSLIDIEQII